jgi:YidC/Oxa1 family membrane protein insertase
MPILIAMFRFFPASIELRQESFLWADDLSTYDSIYDFPEGFSIPWYGDHISLFTLLMAVSIMLYTKINSSMSMTATQEGPMAQQMKIMMYIMPVMMLFFFNSYSSGLSYYYFLANIISIGQTLLIRKVFINEDAIRAKIEKNKKKPKSKKKSGFQKRLEEMAKQRGIEPPKK